MHSETYLDKRHKGETYFSSVDESVPNGANSLNSAMTEIFCYLVCLWQHADSVTGA